MTFLNNLSIIFSTSFLLINFLLSGVLGVISFCGAVGMCGIKCPIYKTLKYIAAMISIGFLSNFSIMLAEPTLFIHQNNLTFLLQISVFSVLIWTVVHELWEFRSVMLPNCKLLK